MSASLPRTRAATARFRCVEGSVGRWPEGPGGHAHKVVRVKRAIPLWLLAAVPSTLMGHWLVYAWVGRSLSDGRHGYAMPSLELTAIVLGLLCAGLLAAALVRAGIIDRVRLETTGWSLWLKLAPVQVGLFAVVERFEGYVPSMAGCLLQCALAGAVAALLALFARFFFRCVLQSRETSAYLQRLLNSVSQTHVGRAPFTASLALCAGVGPIRFGRPPPRA